MLEKEQIEQLQKAKQKLFDNLNLAIKTYENEIKIFRGAGLTMLAITMEAHLKMTTLARDNLKRELKAWERKQEKQAT